MSRARVAKRKPPLAGSPTGQESGTGARLSDAQIAAEVSRRLAWDAAVPEHSVTVKVSQGRVTLHGELKREQQKAAALEDVARLFGVTGVADHTVVKAK